jgi:NAD(P)-dependent dehydrogenase (short-subunit alcohol dehydrogenase family)
MQLGLSNKKAIVTGGSRGIGHAITNTFIQEGVSVATCARGKSALDEAVTQWQEQGATVTGQSVDISAPDAYKAWFESAVKQLGGLDVFVSNVTSMNEYQGEAR